MILMFSDCWLKVFHEVEPKYVPFLPFVNLEFNELIKSDSVLLNRLFDQSSSSYFKDEQFMQNEQLVRFLVTQLIQIGSFDQIIKKCGFQPFWPLWFFRDCIDLSTIEPLPIANLSICCAKAIEMGKDDTASFIHKNLAPAFESDSWNSDPKCTQWIRKIENACIKVTNWDLFDRLFGQTRRMKIPESLLFDLCSSILYHSHVNPRSTDYKFVDNIFLHLGKLLQLPRSQVWTKFLQIIKQNDFSFVLQGLFSNKSKGCLNWIISEPIVDFDWIDFFIRKVMNFSHWKMYLKNFDSLTLMNIINQIRKKSQNEEFVNDFYFMLLMHSKDYSSLIQLLQDDETGSFSWIKFNQRSHILQKFDFIDYLITEKFINIHDFCAKSTMSLKVALQLHQKYNHSFNCTVDWSKQNPFFIHHLDFWTNLMQHSIKDNYCLMKSIIWAIMDSRQLVDHLIKFLTLVKQMYPNLSLSSVDIEPSRSMFKNSFSLHHHLIQIWHIPDADVGLIKNQKALEKWKSIKGYDSLFLENLFSHP